MIRKHTCISIVNSSCKITVVICSCEKSKSALHFVSHMGIMHSSEVSFPLPFPLHILFLSAASCEAAFLFWHVAVRSHGYLPGGTHMYLGLTGSADLCYYLHWVSEASFFLQPLTTLRHIFKEFTHIYLVQATHWHF